MFIVLAIASDRTARMIVHSTYLRTGTLRVDYIRFLAFFPSIGEISDVPSFIARSTENVRP